MQSFFLETTGSPRPHPATTLLPLETLGCFPVYMPAFVSTADPTPFADTPKLLTDVPSAQHPITDATYHERTRDNTTSQRASDPPNTRKPSNKMFHAAFKSRSNSAPHSGQTQERAPNPLSPLGPTFSKHTDHNCLDGKKRSILTNSLPAHSHLYWQYVRNVPQPASEIPRARK